MFDMCYKYNIYKPFVSLGSVQQIMLYWLWLKSPRQSRHLNGRTRDRRQVQASYTYDGPSPTQLLLSGNQQ
jgi:hypothetical protein